MILLLSDEERKAVSAVLSEKLISVIDQADNTLRADAFDAALYNDLDYCARLLQSIIYKLDGNE